MPNRGVTPTPALISTTGDAAGSSTNEPRGAETSSISFVENPQEQAHPGPHQHHWARQTSLIHIQTGSSRQPFLTHASRNKNSGSVGESGGLFRGISPVLSLLIIGESVPGTTGVMIFAPKI